MEENEIKELKERVEKLEETIAMMKYRYDYIANRVETIDAQNGRFRYC